MAPILDTRWSLRLVGRSLVPGVVGVELLGMVVQVSLVALALVASGASLQQARIGAVGFVSAANQAAS